MNRGKSLLYAPAESSLSNSAFPPYIPVTNGSFKFLGSPVGPASHCEAAVLQRVEKIRETLASLRDLQDSQMETTLLRACLALPKIAFALLGIPPSESTRHLFQRCSSSFWRGTATLGSPPPSPTPKCRWHSPREECASH